MVKRHADVVGLGAGLIGVVDRKVHHGWVAATGGWIFRCVFSHMQ